MKNHKVLLSLIWFVIINVSLQFSVYGKDQWIKVKTKNFTLIGNAKEKQIKQVGIKIEQFREAIKRLVPELSKDSPIETKVIVFKDDESFYPFKPINVEGKITEWVTGYFQSGIDTNYIALSVNKQSHITYQTIFHEYIHYLVDTNLGRSNIPPWYNEGLAEYYDQSIVRKDKQILIGSINKAHIKFLQENKLIPLNKFFNLDYQTLRTQDKDSASKFYAQSWLFMHYLMRDKSGRRKTQLNKFLDLTLKNRKTNEAAFKEAFQMSYLNMEAELENFIQTGKFKTKKNSFDKKLTKDIKLNSTLISEAVANGYIGDLLNLREQLDMAQKYLGKSLSANPDISFANSSMGILKLKKKKYEEANKYLLRAIESSDKDYIAYYRYAYFLSQKDAQFNSVISNYTDEEAAVMREYLNKSVSLNPNFPENYRLLGFINLVRKERLDEGVKNLEKALSMYPGKQTYLLNLADIFFRKKDFEKARSIAQNVYKNPAQSNLKKHAKDLLNNIKRTLEFIAEKKAKAKEAQLNGQTTSAAYKKSDSNETTEEELERNRTITLNELINDVLRKPKLGEKRFVGHLSEIKCVKGNVVYTIKFKNKVKKLQSKGFRKLFLMAFTKEMGTFSIGCDAIEKDTVAVLTYKPYINSNKEIMGNLVAIEFVPEDFQLTKFIPTEK